MTTIPEKDHDRLGWRLTTILQMLNQGERLDIDQLAEEFGYTGALSSPPLTNASPSFHWKRFAEATPSPPAYLGRLTFRDIKRFASLAGLKGLFPALDTQFFRELFDSRLQDILSIHGPSYENLRHRLDDFRRLQRAITEHRRVRFTYSKEQDRKTVDIEPYRIINHNGIWYLAGMDANKPKSYAFSKISSPEVLDTLFVLNVSDLKILDQEDSIWLNEKKTEVILTIPPQLSTFAAANSLLSKLSKKYWKTADLSSPANSPIPIRYSQSSVTGYRIYVLLVHQLDRMNWKSN